MDYLDLDDEFRRDDELGGLYVYEYGAKKFKARKEYSCEECGKIITKGTTYYRLQLHCYDKSDGYNVHPQYKFCSFACLKKWYE